MNRGGIPRPANVESEAEPLTTSILSPRPSEQHVPTLNPQKLQENCADRVYIVDTGAEADILNDDGTIAKDLRKYFRKTLEPQIFDTAHGPSEPADKGIRVRVAMWDAPEDKN